ncbi:hypothetical protein VFPPC_09855 [Pochonia chlamydosporia 170]|uniref:Uncharacterized protein n=1 Tax=Pochonia chlamydosporia 170 TaxID=1380566 RepID=A0A179FDM7_METCM|nr:hypothetical protein VFPPC_09855 [Pochonia chlamydosporia 170]OAQ63458.1 hypothetical protein VFPPC_09855 [Pochonia chlamydosporia 170]
MSCHVDKEKEPELANTTESSPKEQKTAVAALSNEIMDEIFEILLHEKKLGPCGAVARSWEKPVRRIFFRELTTTDQPEDFKHLIEIVTPERSRWVKRLHFVVFIPYSFDVDDKDNDDVFERSLASLLRIMAAWHHDGQAPRVLSITSSWLWKEPDWFTSWSRSRGERCHTRSISQESTFKYSRFNLDCETLPVLAYMKQLEIRLSTHATYNTTGRRIALATWPKLLSKMPSVTTTSMTLIDEGFRDVAQQRSDRLGLAESFRDDGYMSASTVRDVKLDMKHAIFRTPTIQHCELLSPYSFDPLSASLRNWSHNLVRLKLKGKFDQSLFWPQDNEWDGYEATEEPLWPNLEEFSVGLHQESPSGKQYLLPGDHHRVKILPVPTSNSGYSPPRLSDDLTARNEIEQGDPWGQYASVPSPQPFRREKRNSNAHEVPCPETFNPVVEAWAQALRNMPSLQSAQLFIDCYIDEGSNKRSDDCEFVWRIGYEAPGGIRWDEKWKPFRRLVLYNVMGWRPENSTMDKLRQVGEKSHPGRDMKILDGERRHLPPIDDSTPPSEWPPWPYEW